MHEKTALFGRKCSRCGKHSHEGAFHARHHWYCNVCRPLEQAAKVITNSSTDEEYKEHLRRHKLQSADEML